MATTPRVGSAVMSANRLRGIHSLLSLARQHPGKVRLADVARHIFGPGIPAKVSAAARELTLLSADLVGQKIDQITIADFALREMEKSGEKLEEATSELNTALSTITDLKQEKNMLDQALEDLKKSSGEEITHLTNERNDIAAKLDTAAQNLEDLQQTLQQAEQRARDAEKAVDKIRQDLGQEIADLKEQLAQATSPDELNALRSDLEAKERELSNLQRKFDQLQHAKTESDRAKEAAEASAVALEEQVAGLNESLEQAREELEELGKRLAQEQEAKEGLSRQLEQAQQRMEQLSREVKTTTALLTGGSAVLVTFRGPIQSAFGLLKSQIDSIETDAREDGMSAALDQLDFDAHFQGVKFIGPDVARVAKRSLLDTESQGPQERIRALREAITVKLSEPMSEGSPVARLAAIATQAFLQKTISDEPDEQG